MMLDTKYGGTHNERESATFTKDVTILPLTKKVSHSKCSIQFS
jgi:hypothetical protein